MSDPLASAELTRDGAVVLAALRGEIDLSNGAALGARITGECLAARALVVDLREVTYMDSAGLALIDGLAAEMAAGGGVVHLVAPEGCPAHRVVALSGLAVAMHADVPRAMREARG